jgi:hypothetical protein
VESRSRACFGRLTWTLGGGQELARRLPTAGEFPAVVLPWRTKFGGMDSKMAKQLQELQKESSRLKTLAAGQSLDMLIRCLTSGRRPAHTLAWRSAPELPRASSPDGGDDDAAAAGGHSDGQRGDQRRAGADRPADRVPTLRRGWQDGHDASALRPCRHASRRRRMPHFAGSGTVPAQLFPGWLPRPYPAGIARGPGLASGFSLPRYSPRIFMELS